MLSNVVVDKKPCLVHRQQVHFVIVTAHQCVYTVIAVGAVNRSNEINISVCVRLRAQTQAISNSDDVDKLLKRATRHSVTAAGTQAPWEVSQHQIFTLKRSAEVQYNYSTTAI